MNAPTALMYSVPTGAGYPTVAFVIYPMANGYVVHYPDGQMVVPYYTDSGGVPVGGYALPVCAEKRDWEAGCVPYPSMLNPEMPYPYEPPSQPSDPNIPPHVPSPSSGLKGEGGTIVLGYIIDDWIWQFQCKVDPKGKLSRAAYCSACEAACANYCFTKRPDGVVDITDCLLVCMRAR